MPLFSIVVPAYNAESTLGETLDAVRDQESADWECVIVDDGSTDATLAIAREYSAQDGRFRVVHQDNRGSGGAYNTGVRAAAGQWVTLCSADDVLLPAHLGAMSRAIADSPGHDIYSCNGFYWYADGRRVQAYPGSAPARSWTLSDLFRECFFSVGACYRRTLFDQVGGYEEGAYGEDYDFWLRAMAGGATHWYVPQTLALHRVSASQKSADATRAYESDIRSISRVVKEFGLGEDQLRAARKALGHRERLLAELAAPGSPYVRLRRLARTIIGGRRIR